MSLKKSVASLRTHVACAGAKCSDVSQWSVGMQIHHSCLVMLRICETLGKSEAPPPPAKFSLARLIVFVGGRIPRGSARSPEAVLPTELSETELLSVVNQAEVAIEKAQTLSRDTWFKHFRFGVLTRDQALRFIEIHNKHHLRIVDDIIKRSQ